MPTEVEIERDIDPATGNVTKTVTEKFLTIQEML